MVKSSLPKLPITTGPPGSTFSASRLTDHFLSTLYNGLAEGVIVVNLKTLAIVYWNRGAEAMFGYAPAEIAGKPAEILYLDESSFRRMFETAEPRIEQQEFWRGEWDFRRRSGAAFTGELTATLLGGENTDEPCIVMVIRDITKRKQAEENIRSLNQELEKRVRERTAQLEAAVETLKKESVERKRAEERLRSKDRLSALGATAAKLAHEIASPLDGMHTTVQLLERYLQKDDGGETVLTTLQDLKSEIDRLRSLLLELREFSRPMVLDLKPTHLPELAAETLKLEMPECEQKHIDVSLEFDPQLPTVLADSLKMQQVVLNLSKNAIEAMPQGGKLTIRGYSNGESVYLEVQDTGEGISSGMPIFDLYITSKPQGTGLGLVIVQQIIAAHEGAIEYTSEPGRGTTFRVILPRRSKS